MDKAAAKRGTTKQRDGKGLFIARNVLDGLLLALACWFVIPAFLTAREWQIPLPGGDYISGTLSANNLTAFWVLLAIRIGLGLRASRPARLTGFVRSRTLPVRGLLVFALAWLVYMNAGLARKWPSGDTIPAKLIPISIIEEGNLDLDEFVQGIPKVRRYGLCMRNGRMYATYPPATALTALPLYGLAALVVPDSFSSWQAAYAVEDGDDVFNIANVLETFSAAFITALSVVAVWLFCMRIGSGEPLAWGLTGAYAFGTPAMSTAGLALWQHGPALLVLSLVCLLLWRAAQDERPGGSLLIAGLLAGWGYFCRPTLFVIIGVMCLWLLWRFRWKAFWFFVPCGILVCGVLVFNYTMYGSFSGGYARNMSFFQPFDIRVAASLLFSPSRGLFVFCPFLLLALWRLPAVLRSSPRGLPPVLLGGVLTTLILFSCWGTWAGGVSFGPRYMAEAILLLVLLMPYGEPWLTRKRLPRWIFIVFVLFSCHLHILGARHGDHGWTEDVFNGDDFAVIWDWHDSQPAWTFNDDLRKDYNAAD
jgi:hypothetical protein